MSTPSEETSSKKPAKPYVGLSDAHGRMVTPPTSDQVAQAKADIEKRWNMSLDAVMIMMHNHIFGATTQAMLDAPTANEAARRRRKKHRQQQHHAHMKKNPQGLHPTNPSTGGSHEHSSAGSAQ